MKKTIQIDWLEYWFKPVVTVVGYSEFISTVRQLEQGKARIFSVDVDSRRGQYRIHHQQQQPKPSNDKHSAIHEAMAGKDPSAIKDAVGE